jgi:hypothetical protein
MVYNSQLNIFKQGVRMVHFNQKLVIAGSIALLTLAGGYKSLAFANSTSKIIVAAVPSKTSGFTSLQTVVTKTLSAVDTGKFSVAKEEFNKFEDAWKKVEDGLKKKSPDSYKAIEENYGIVTKEVKASKPSKSKLVTALQSLDKAIVKAAKA